MLIIVNGWSWSWHVLAVFFVLKNMVRSQLKSHKHTWDCSWRNDMWTPTPWCRNQGILFGLKKWSSPNRMRIELQYNLCIPNSCVYVYNTWKKPCKPNSLAAWSLCCVVQCVANEWRVQQSSCSASKTLQLPKHVIDTCWNINNITAESTAKYHKYRVETIIVYISGWWFGTFHIFPYIGNVIIPFDELHHFSEG